MRRSAAQLALATCLLAASVIPVEAQTAAALSVQVGRDGAKHVVDKFYSAHGHAWAEMLAKISSGDTAWLNVAVALLKGTDAGSGEDLRYAVSKALLRNPTGVLRLAAPAFGLENVCSVPVIEPTKAEVGHYLAQGNAALKRVTAGDIAMAAQQCRAYLNRT